MEKTYQYYKQAFAGCGMPFGFVDLDLLDRNVRDVARRAGDKKIRIASKSLRCVPLIERILASGPQFQGVMAYSAREAVFLSYQGLDDLLIAYPVLNELDESGLFEELRRGKKIVCTVDATEHVDALDAIGREFDVVAPVCIDVDMSSEFPGLHFGVRRSPLKQPDQVVRLCRHIERCGHVRLEALMGYEGQIAGLPDRVPGQRAKNLLVRLLKRRSIREVAERRARVLDALERAGLTVSVVNGGGTGSLESTRREARVTEVTVGSGFFSPVLFDWYANFRHLPAAGYAIEITRRPTPDIYTCHGGGYVASGVGRDKQPRPYLPQGAELLPAEGAGEVQTPIRYRGPERLALGDPIFMRYSKAGEMCERFNCLLGVSNGTLAAEFPTYRGEGQVFL